MAGRQCSILVIDEDEAVSRMLAIALHANSGRTTTREDAESSLAALAEIKPDVIFCELNLPGMNGMEFVRQVKSDKRLSSIPVFLMSEAKEPKGHEAEAFLSKPFDALDAVDLVEQHVNRR